MRTQKRAGESARKVEKKLRLHQERHPMMRRFGAERARMGSLATSYTKVPTRDGKHLSHVKRKIRHRHSLCWRCVSRRSREHQSKIARYYCDHPVDEHVPVNDCSYVGSTIDSAFFFGGRIPALAPFPICFFNTRCKACFASQFGNDDRS